MKRIYKSSFIALILLTASYMNAQRYIEEVFTDVSVTSDVTYGVNATILYISQVGETVPEELKMDIYEPVGDTETERPMVLVFHTGNFLPPILNRQISGSKSDNSAVEICQQLARRGYVAASVDYRLGWNPAAETQPLRALGLIQAAYRGVQDGNTAIRYIRASVKDGNPYGVDPEKIVAWGNGTGGYLTLGLASLNDYLEIINTTNGPGKFLLDANGDGTPETPMVVPGFHGDIEGKALTVTPAAGFGLPAGDTTCYPNHIMEESRFALQVNIGGAVGDISWIDSVSVPTITVQSAFDFFAPYGDAVLIVPGTNDPIVQVQGGSFIAAKQNELGNNDSFATEGYFDAMTNTARDNSATAGHPYYEGLFPFIKPANSLNLDEGVVIDWWDPNAPAPGFGMNIPYNQLPHPSGGTFHDQGLLLNEGMSAEKARANIADIMAYVLPRACVSLELGDCGLSSTNELVLPSSLLSVSPNPASTSFVVKTTASDMNLESINIIDLQGKTVATLNDINTNSQTVDASELTKGMYIIQAKVADGVIISRITVE